MKDICISSLQKTKIKKYKYSRRKLSEYDKIINCICILQKKKNSVF